MRGRIVLRLDRGLGWTKPLVVASCGVCGAELARHPDPAAAARAAGRRRCPACGTRVARRLPGTTSLTTDRALAGGRPVLPGRPRRPRDHDRIPRPFALEGGEPMPAARTWLRTSEAARRLYVTPRTVIRWADRGLLDHRRTLGGHRRYDPELIEQLVAALTHRP